MNQVKHKWDPEDYAKNSSAQLQWAQELISKLNFQGNESVLDIGCGDGKISAQLALAVKNGTVLGIDLSEDMIQLAKKQFTPSEYPNLSFLCMDATSITLSEKFDIAFSSASLHWIKDQLAVLQGVHRCLNSGGRILFQMGGRGNEDELFDVLPEIVSHPDWKRYFDGFTPPYYFFEPEEYKQWLAESKFHPVRVELIQKDMQHQGIEGLRGWLRTTWFTYTDRLPLELRAAFIDKVIESYIKEHPLDNSGNTHVNMVRMEVEAYS